MNTKSKLWLKIKVKERELREAAMQTMTNKN